MKTLIVNENTNRTNVNAKRIDLRRNGRNGYNSKWFVSS